MPRLFVAIDIPERIKDDITATYTAMPGTRWMDEENIHLTLRFIGEVAGDIAGRIASVLRSVSGGTFTLRVSNVGFFPLRKEPRILWLGLTESQDLLHLQSRIERSLTSVGIEHEERKFHPHITVARLSGTPVNKVAEYVALNSLFKTESFSISSFHLYSSFLREKGAIHQKIETYSLEK